MGLCQFGQRVVFEKELSQSEGIFSESPEYQSEQPVYAGDAEGIGQKMDATSPLE
jgi:hypothetical protein